MGGSAKRVTAEVMSRLIISYLLIPRGAKCRLSLFLGELTSSNRGVIYSEGLRPVLSDMATVWTGKLCRFCR